MRRKLGQLFRLRHGHRGATKLQSNGCGGAVVAIIGLVVLASIFSSREKPAPQAAREAAPQNVDRPAPVQPKPEAPKPDPVPEVTPEAAAQTPAPTKDDQPDLDEQMAEYEVAKAEYHAAEKLRLARQLLLLSHKADANGDGKTAARLSGSVDRWYESIVQFYPETQAAADAERLLDGQEVEDRPMPPLPKLPQGVTAKTDDVADKSVRAAAAKKVVSDSPKRKVNRRRDWSPETTFTGGGYAGPAGIRSYGGAKTVHVRSYTRKDGTHVRAHTRSPPGSGRGRRR
jgi:hypothetical protein